MHKEGHRYDLSSVLEETFHFIHLEAFYNDVDVCFTMLISVYRAISIRHVKPRAVQIKNNLIQKSDDFINLESFQIKGTAK